MFGSNVLDVGIGIILIYLVLGLVCSTVNEYVAQVLATRSNMLWTAVMGLFQNSPKANEFAQSLYDHDLIDALSPAKQGAKPSYIPSHLFSLALVDRLGFHDAQKLASASKPLSIASFLTNQSGADQTILAPLLPLASAAGGDVDRFRQNVETWFDGAMDRVSGWYKRQVQATIFFIAFAVVLVFNADTIMLVDTLWSNPAARAAAVSAAKDLTTKSPNSAQSGAGTQAAATPAPTFDPQALKQAESQVQSLLGWSGPISPGAYNYKRSDPHRFPDGWGEWIYKLLGLAVTAFAASLGAPFWFDILKKFMSIRNAGSAPDEKTPGAAQPTPPRIASVGAGAAANGGGGSAPASPAQGPAFFEKQKGDKKNGNK